MLWFQRLRRDEEGQTLVLGAIFGLILALMILGTINLGRAVYDKMQVQTACDDGAYSQAAVEARVLNFTAYTNRAMVVHYASIMAASAYLTWLHFMYVFVKLAFDVLKMVPYIGAIFNILDQVFKVIMQVLDWAVALMTPIVSAANTVLYALQEGAWSGVYLGRLSKLPPEAHSGDPSGALFQPLWPNLIPLANMAVFSQARGKLTMPQNFFDSVKMLVNSKDDRTQQDRLHMIEVANSARTAWVAYGDRYGNPSASPAARHWGWKLGCITVGAVSRTELGSYAPKGGIGGANNAPGQVFSGDRSQIAAKCSILGIKVEGTISLFGMSTLDHLFMTKSAEYFGPGGDKWWAKLLGYLLGGLGPFKAMVSYAQNQAKVNPDARLFWISPYVSFAPRAAGKPGGGVLSALGNFAQPDVILGLAHQGVDYNRQTGAAGVFGRRFTLNGGGAGRGTVDFRYLDTDTPRLPGAAGNLALLHKGFNALCAAQVYYHRPGDWREMPNFFNPLWGARLMPVMDSNAASALGLGKVPGLSRLLMH